MARLMPMESSVGTMMPWMMESPMPASGPMSVALMLLGISSETSPPRAMFSSREVTMPLMIWPVCGSVLKKTEWRTRRRRFASGSSA